MCVREGGREGGGAEGRLSRERSSETFEPFYFPKLYFLVSK